jgi:hypothetical protein
MRRATGWTGFVMAICVTLDAGPSVYPTGTTIYDPARAWSGYTAFVLPDTGAVVVDMNGRVVRRWTEFEGASGGPLRILPGGHVIGALGRRPPNQESLAVAQFDWAGKEEWRFDRAEQVPGRDGAMVWSARQHHDWQRPSLPAGYYSPDAKPAATGERTLILGHRNLTNPAIHPQPLEDDYLYEVDWNGKIAWEWLANQHVDELGFSPAAREAIRTGGQFNKARGSVDWLHINSATYVGPNRWFDAGDQRFHPDHVIVSSRQANIVAIVSRDGKIAWRMGPDYRESDALRAIGQVIGQHHPHIIPKGLPGAGNLMVFDNGGAAGYGPASPGSPNGVNTVGRGSSRVIEIDPVTMKKMWEYSVAGNESYRFFSHYVSSAQRLPNGNTLITEGADGRLFEVTTAGEIVWEYVSPFFTTGANRTNRVYRAYRLPYAWVPQLERPVERAVVARDVSEFRVPD